MSGPALVSDMDVPLPDSDDEDLLDPPSDDAKLGIFPASDAPPGGAGQRGVRGRADYSGRQRRGAVRLERARGGLFVPRERTRERS